MAESVAPSFMSKPMEAGGGPQPRDVPMPGQGEQRPKGPPVKMLTSDDAFISDRTLCELMDPVNLNSGVLQDIYQLREDDFEEPQELEIWYMVGAQPQREFVFIDPLNSQERPRICVSVKAVQAMHRAIAVLTRKLDNVLVTLRHCREHYWKELTLLRELLYRKENEIKEMEEQHVAEHYAAFFNQVQYQDEVTVSLFKERLEQATFDLDQKLQMKQAEIRKLHQRINKMEMGFDALDRVEQRDMEEQLGDLQCENEALREEREEWQQQMFEKEQELKENANVISELKEEIALTRELVQKREVKHNKLVSLIEEEKSSVEKALEAERKEWQDQRRTLTADNSRLAEEVELHKAAAKTAREAKMEAADSKIKLIKSKKRYSDGRTEDTRGSAEDEEKFEEKTSLKDVRRSSITELPPHLAALLSDRRGSKGKTEAIEEGAGSAEDAAAAAAEAEKKRTFLEKVEEKRRKTVEAHKQIEKEKMAQMGAAEAGEGPPKNDESEASRPSDDNDELTEIEKLWAQVYKKPERKVEEEGKGADEEEAAAQLDPDELISLVVESIESLAKQGPAARKKAAMALICEMSLNEMRALRDSLDARTYAALNGLKEQIDAASKRQRSGKPGPVLKSRPGSPISSKQPPQKAGFEPAASPRASQNAGESGSKERILPSRAPSPSPKSGALLRPASPSGGRSGDSALSRPTSRNRTSSRRIETNQPSPRRKKGAKASKESGIGNEDEDSSRRKEVVDDPTEVDMSAVSEKLKSHIQDGDWKGEEDKQSFSSSGSLDGHSWQGSRQGSAQGSAPGSEQEDARNSQTRRSPGQPSRSPLSQRAASQSSPEDDVPVDDLLASWSVKPMTAETESTRPGNSAGTGLGSLEDLPDVDDTSPLALRIKRQKNLNALDRVLKDPRLGEPRKLRRTMSPDMADMQMKRKATDAEEEEDYDDEDGLGGRRSKNSAKSPLLEAKQESIKKDKTRAKSLPTPDLEGMRLMDQLTREEKQQRGRPVMRKTKTAKLRSPSGSSTPNSSRFSSPRQSLSPLRSGAASKYDRRKSLAKSNASKSRRGSLADYVDDRQRSHSLPPCWSMPMLLEPHHYPELASVTNGLGRLLVELPDLPPRHFQVASELLLAGWILSHPQGHAYQSFCDASDFDPGHHGHQPTGHSVPFFDSVEVAEHASRAGFTYMPDLAMPGEIIVKTLGGGSQRSSQKIFRQMSPADGDAAAGSRSPETPPGRGSDAHGWSSDMRSSTGGATRQSLSERGSEAHFAAGHALSNLRKGNLLAKRLTKGLSKNKDLDFANLFIGGTHVGATSSRGGVRPASSSNPATQYKLGTDNPIDNGPHDSWGRPVNAMQGRALEGEKRTNLRAEFDKLFQEPYDSKVGEEATPATAFASKKRQLMMKNIFKGSATSKESKEASMGFELPALNSSGAFPASKFAPHSTMMSPQQTGQQPAADSTLAFGGFLPNRDTDKSSLQKARRTRGFRVVAGNGSLARGRAPLQQSDENVGLALNEHLPLARNAADRSFKKPRMVSVGTQTNLAVTTRFEVVPEIDETESMKWRETARHADKEELRMRIAKELLALCKEIAKLAGMDEDQDDSSHPSLFTPSSTAHVGEDLMSSGKSPNFNNLGLSVAGLHRPLLPKSGRGSVKSARARKQQQSQSRNQHIMALLERGGGALGAGLEGDRDPTKRAGVNRPTLRELAHHRPYLSSDSDDPAHPIKRKSTLMGDISGGRLKQFAFHMEGTSSGDEELAQVCVCGRNFTPDETFCHKCGAQRPGVPKKLNVCACGNPFRPGAVFCRRCGALCPMDALGGAGVARHRHDEDELDEERAGMMPRTAGRVTFQGKEADLGTASLNKNSAATMSTVASESSLANQIQLASLASDEQVQGQHLPDKNPLRQLFEHLPGGADRKKMFPGLSAQGMAATSRPATLSRIPRPGTVPIAPKLDQAQRRIDVNRIVNAIREADDGSMGGNFQNIADDVVERSRQWLSHDNRQHGGALTARQLSRPATQEQGRRNRSMELPPVEADDSRWYPAQSRDSATSLPLRSLLKR